MVSTAPPSKATSTWVTLFEPIAAASLPDPFERWFASRGWEPRAHQLELLAKARAGRSVLLIAPTGAGKTLAGFLPTLVELSAAASRRPPTAQASSVRSLAAAGTASAASLRPPPPLAGDGRGGGSRRESDSLREPPPDALRASPSPASGRGEHDSLRGPTSPAS